MTDLATLWLPILLSAVFVFIASSILHTVIPWHLGDYRRLPDEEGARRALAAMAIPPGDYTVPHCASTKEMGSDEFMAKLSEGPNVMMTVRPNGAYRMGPPLIQWLILTLVVALVTGCMAAAVLAPGATTGAIWHVAGLTTLLAYGVGSWSESIWFGRKWSSTVKSTIDSAIYAAITAATFAWLWPTMVM